MKFEKYLTETTLSRLWKHANNKNIPVSIITAFRSENTNKENLQRNKVLAAKVKNAGYGYFFLEGHWIENTGTEDEVKVKESSIFIVGNNNDNGRLVGLIKQFINDYEQEAAIIKREGMDIFELIYNNGKVEKIGKLKPNNIDNIYSKIRRGNKTFIFEDYIMFAGNWFSKMIEKTGE